MLEEALEAQGESPISADSLQCQVSRMGGRTKAMRSPWPLAVDMLSLSKSNTVLIFLAYPASFPCPQQRWPRAQERGSVI
jgi:hypothetical protein